MRTSLVLEGKVLETNGRLQDIVSMFVIDTGYQ